MCVYMYEGICRPGQGDWTVSVSIYISSCIYDYTYDNTVYLHNALQKLQLTQIKMFGINVAAQLFLLVVYIPHVAAMSGGDHCVRGPHLIPPPHPHCYIATFALAGTSTSRCIDIP